MKAGTRRPLYLPDELAEGMQVVASLFDYQIDRLTMRYIHESVFDLLRLLMRLIDIRSTLMWFLMFNQYQQPFDTLRIMTDWWFSYFRWFTAHYFRSGFRPYASISIFRLANR